MPADDSRGGGYTRCHHRIPKRPRRGAAASVGAEPIRAQEQGRDLLEIVDDRHNRGSTIVTSQLLVDHWHEAIANPTVADAILDRLVHNAHRLTLNGDSMRKVAAKRSGLDASPAS